MSDLQELKDSAARIDIFWSGSSETVEQANTDHQKGCADADGVSELHAAVFFPTLSVFLPRPPPGRSPTATPIVGGLHWPTNH